MEKLNIMMNIVNMKISFIKKLNLLFKIKLNNKLRYE